MPLHPVFLSSWNNQSSPISWLAPLATLLLGVVLTFFLCLRQLGDERLRLQQELDEQARQSVVRIEKHLQSYQQILEDTAGLLMLKPDLDDRDFKAYVDRLQLDSRFPGTQGISYIFALTPTSLPAHIARQKITRPWFEFRSAASEARETYAVVTFAEPLTPANRKVVGYDSIVDSGRATPLIRARDLGKVSVSGRLTLVQDEGGKPSPSVLIAAPIYQNKTLIDTREARRQHLHGWAAAPLRIAQFMQGVLGNDVLAPASMLAIKVFDLDENGKPELLFENIDANGTQPGADALRRQADIPFAGRIWRIELITLPGFAKKIGFHWPQETALLGVLGSLLLAAVFWQMTHGRNVALRLAKDMTRELRESKELLQAVIEGSNDAIFVKDAEGRFLLANSTLRRWLGEEGDTGHIKQRDKDLVTPDILAQIREEDQRIMFKQQTVTSERQIRTHDGLLRTLQLTKGPLRTADGEVTGVFGIARDISRQKKARDQIWRQANYDALTNLPNRRLFRDRLQGEIRRAHRNACLLALLFIDLDNFKDVNDSLGHDQGDQLLIEAARRISRCVRESDVVARMGGDEFVVILPDITESAHAARIAQTLLSALAQSFPLAQGTVYVSASIGITVYPNDAQDDIALIQCADQAMYATKAQGRNDFSFFTPVMQSQAQQRIRLATDLHQALADQQLALHFQPVVDSHHYHVLKAEALLRWQHPELGFIPPSTFIPVAEETGMIIEIGDWVFRQAADFVLRWQQERLARGATRSDPQPQVSVNMSPQQFLGTSDVLAWCSYLESIGLAPGSVSIEITEGMLLERNPAVQKKLTQLSGCGIMLALDDFGTGYSAMSYLKKFSVDFLKIDQTFIRDMENNPNDQAIVEAIILMAHKLGINVVAEGVENQRQQQMLTSSGCDFLQGYLFGHPMPEAAFMERFMAPVPEPASVPQRDR